MTLMLEILLQISYKKSPLSSTPIFTFVFLPSIDCALFTAWFISDRIFLSVLNRLENNLDNTLV